MTADKYTRLFDSGKNLERKEIFGDKIFTFAEAQRTNVATAHGFNSPLCLAPDARQEELRKVMASIRARVNNAECDKIQKALRGTIN